MIYLSDLYSWELSRANLHDSNKLSPLHTAPQVCRAPGASLPRHEAQALPRHDATPQDRVRE